MIHRMIELNELRASHVQVQKHLMLCDLKRAEEYYMLSHVIRINITTNYPFIRTISSVFIEWKPTDLTMIHIHRLALITAAMKNKKPRSSPAFFAESKMRRCCCRDDDDEDPGCSTIDKRWITKWERRSSIWITRRRNAALFIRSNFFIRTHESESGRQWILLPPNDIEIKNCNGPGRKKLVCHSAPWFMTHPRSTAPERRRCDGTPRRRIKQNNSND